MTENRIQISEGTYRRMGAVPGKDGIQFSCFCAKGTPSLLIYRRGTMEIEAEIPFLKARVPGAYYSMCVKFPGEAAIEYNFRMGQEIVTDPYAPHIMGRETFGKRSDFSVHALRGVAARKKYNWEEDVCPNLPFEDGVMYQLHVRGYTMHKNSGTRKKGTFHGLREKIPYWKELGINQICLMPAYDFDELPFYEGKRIWNREDSPKKQPQNGGAGKENPGKEPLSKIPVRLNYWGYGTGYYFAPKASYASRPERAEEEMKDLVKACHREKIEVLMEFAFGDAISFERIFDCLSYWAEEYHIDGFVVRARDSVMEELARLPLFGERKLIGLWFSDSAVKNRMETTQRMLAEANDGFMNDCRRILKGEENQIAGLKERIRRNPEKLAVINYMTHHDGFTLYDLVSYDHKHNKENGEQGRDGSDYNFSWNCGQEGPTGNRKIRELRMRQRKNAYALLLLSQGTPMLLAGDEFGNSQSGNNNPYCHDSELTWTDWGKKRKEEELTRYVKQLLAFRKQHRILHGSRPLKGNDSLACGYPDLSFHGKRAWYAAENPSDRVLGCMYAGRYEGEEGFLYTVYNFYWEPQKFALPQLPKGCYWEQVMDTSRKESFVKEEEAISYEGEKTITVPERTVMVLKTAGGEEKTEKRKNTAAVLGKDKGTL